jgi:predicted nucleic acid-binding protein
MNIVLDASAAAGLILKQGDYQAVSSQIESADWVGVPDLYTAEITNVFWKYHQFQNVDLETCQNGVHDALKLPDEFIDARELFEEAFSLACQSALPVYDALYLVTARRHDALLLTADTRLAEKAKKYNIRVQLN